MQTTHSSTGMEYLHPYKSWTWKGCFVTSISGCGENRYPAEQICRMIDVLADNIFVKFGRGLSSQVIGIPMGTNCAPLLADLFLYLRESDFLDSLIRSGQSRLAKLSKICYRYVDDFIVFNKKKFINYVKKIAHRN